MDAEFPSEPNADDVGSPHCRTNTRYVDPDPECAEDRQETARAVGVPIAVAATVAGLYVGTYGVYRYLDYTAMLGERGTWLQFVVLAGLVVLHGLLHAAAYASLGGGTLRDVTLDVALSPQDSLEPLRVSVLPSTPMSRWAYRAGVAIPGVLLGLAPAAWALATGNPLALFVGLVGVLLTGSDVNALVDSSTHPDVVDDSEPVSSSPQ